MKILFVHTFYSLRGGEETIVEEELALLRKQYDVEILYFKNSTGIKGALQFLFSIWNVHSALKVRKKIKSFQPDVVQLHNWHFASGPLIIRVVKRMKIPVVHTIHNYRLLCPSGILMHNNKLFLDSLNQSFPWTAISQKAYRNSMVQTFWLGFVVWFHKLIGTWKMIDVFSCQTNFAIELFRKSKLNISKNQFFLKPNFIDYNLNKTDKPDELCFLFVGRLSIEKGIYLMLDAFKVLPFKLKIAGEGPLKEIVLKACKESPNIFYLGNLEKEKVFTELGKTQALLFPSIWYEGMPMTIIESFSTGTPVIASNLGAMTCMIQNEVNGFHFIANNLNSLINAIISFTNLSKAKKNEMNSNALFNYRNIYTPEKQLDFFQEIYKLAISKNQSNSKNQNDTFEAYS